jgi:hypothetical protein
MGLVNNNNLNIQKVDKTQNEPQEKKYKNKTSEYDDIRKKVDDSESFKIEKTNNNNNQNHKKLLNIF